MDVEGEFAHLIAIARDPNIPSEIRSKQIADHIRPTAASLKLRAHLRQKFEQVSEHMTEAELHIVKDGFGLSSEWPSEIPHLIIDLGGQGMKKYSGVPVFGNFREIHSFIEVKLDEDVILALTTSPWRTFHGVPLSAEDQKATFAICQQR